MLSAMPLNEEFCKGHAGRLSQWNHMDSSRQMLAKLDSMYSPGRQKWQPEPHHRLIARLIGMDATEYAKKHSILPFVRIVTKTEDELGHFDRGSSKIPHAVFMQEREHAFFCRKCAECDAAARGFSYWRRLHQIIGIDWCEEHGIPLSYVARKDPFEVSPHLLVRQAQDVNHELAELVVANPFVYRYYQIARLFLTEGKRVTRFTASACIGTQAKRLGLQICQRGKLPTLSDHIKESFPMEWLAEHYPALLKKDACVRHVPLDGAYRSQLSHGQVYAMSLAALFDNAEVAITDFYMDMASRISAASTWRLSRIAQERQAMLEVFVRNNGFHAQIQREIGGNVRHLNAKLKRLGMPSLHFLDEMRRQTLLEFFKQASVECVKAWTENMRLLIRKDKHAASSLKTWEREGMFSFV